MVQLPSSGIERSPGGRWIPSGRYLILLLLLVVVVTLAAEETAGHSEAAVEHDGAVNGIEEENHLEDALNGVEEHGEGHEIPPAHAVLFPCFVLTIGVVVYYLLSRFAPALPYTAVMFLIGVMMGIGAELINPEEEKHVQESLDLWIAIDSEVLLLVFLPGLLFKDAVGQNVHLFWMSLPQLFIFAFPLVLAGTTLTACIGYYIFPYNWSFNLAMTFGSILSATDPVAVAALLEEVGAPPRLKVHVAGESLLNDGAAIVFFSIFSLRFFEEIGLEEGQEVDFVEGIGLFCRKALGSIAIGLAFGITLLGILFMLDRRFYREENVVEVVATVGIAYIGFYVAEVVCSTSGVIATVTTGLVFKFFGTGMVNDPKLFDDFWTLVEHLLNTILFALAGVIWGAVVTKDTRDDVFTAKDWGYLVLLYVLLNVIRGVLFATVYPIISRIGLKSSWQEATFQVYGGLRGAVGIALALFLDKETSTGQGVDKEIAASTTRIFVYVGGIAFMTLVVNGLTAGPLLIKLGLADSTETRERIVACYQVRYRAHLIDEFVRLLTFRRFNKVNFALIRHHVPQLADLTRVQLLEAVDRHKESTPAEDYRPPELKHILPYLPEVDEGKNKTNYFEKGEDKTPSAPAMDRRARVEQRLKSRRKARHKRRSSTMRFMLEGEPLSAKEFRTLFVSILRAAYHKQVKEGELMTNHFLTIALLQSLEFADEAVSNGEPLKDWDYVTIIDRPVTGVALKIKNRAAALGCMQSAWAKRASMGLKITAARVRIDRSLSFMSAHKWAQDFFTKEFQDANSEMSEAGKIVLEESRAQYAKAETVLNKIDQREVELAVSHKFCTILLFSSIFYIEKLVEVGLLKDQEAEHMVEHVEEDLDKVLSCDEVAHPGEIKITDLQDDDSVSSEEHIQA